jgi:hypothetical protein
MRELLAVSVGNMAEASTPYCYLTQKSFAIALDRETPEVNINPAAGSIKTFLVYH